MPIGYDYDVKGLRERLGLSQNELARLLDMGVSAIARWEQGVRKPSPEAIGKMERLAQRGPPEELKRPALSPDRLRDLRAQLGLSQQALAERLGVSIQSVHRWETSKVVPKRNAVKKIETLERRVKRGRSKSGPVGSDDAD